MVRNSFILAFAVFIVSPASADQIGGQFREVDQSKRVTVAELAEIRSKCRRAPTKACILRDAFQTALTIETPDIRDTALASIVMAHLSSGDIRAARQTSWHIGNEDMQAEAKRNFANNFAAPGEEAKRQAVADAAEAEFNRANTQIEAAAKIADAGDFIKALKLAKSFNHLFARTNAISYIARRQAESGDIEGALRTADSIPPNVVFPALRVSPHGDALYAIAKVQLEKGEISAALATVRKIEVISPYPIPMADIIRAQLKSGDVTAAIETAISLTDEKYRLLSLEGLFPDSVPPPTKEMLRRTVELMRGVERSSQCAYADPSHTLSCNRLRKEIRTVQTKVNDPKRQPPETPVEHAVSGDIQGALKMAAALDDTHSKRSKTQREIAIIIAKKGDVTRARSLTRSISDDTQRDLALSVISDFQATAGNIEGALGAARSIMGNAKRGFTLNVIVRLLAKSGKINDALALANEIRSDAWRSQTIGEIAITIAEDERIDDAIALARSITRTPVSDHTFENIAQLQGKAGRPTDALSTMRNIADSEVRVRSLVNLAQKIRN